MMKKASLASPSFTIVAPGENSVGTAELRIDRSWRVDNPLKSGAERRALISWEKAHRTPIQLAMTTSTNRIARTTQAVTELTPRRNSNTGACADRPIMVAPPLKGGQAPLDPHPACAEV